jgi:hypothetical protein
MKWKVETLNGIIVASIPGTFWCRHVMAFGLVTGGIDE